MNYQPLYLFAEQNHQKVNSAFMLFYLLIQLELTKEFVDVVINKNDLFDGEDLMLIRTPK
jgi:hypothetical protein